jgi:hypothetical protein
VKWITDKHADLFVLECSGREFYANNQIIGIDPDSDYVSEGADGGIGAADSFSSAERAELADYMIARWQVFKEFK